MKILVVEDDELGRAGLVRTLSNWGHEVVEAADGLAGWREFQARREALDIAVLDWLMPGMDGLELCRRCRTMPGPAYIFIIMLTAKDNKADILAGLRAGADDYMVKPFDLEELEARIGVGKRVVELERGLAGKVAELESALAHVKRLRNLLPICSYCKRIRADGDYWQEVERYISEHADVKFSHGICPECMKTLVEKELGGPS